MIAPLHRLTADATRLLTQWQPPDPAQESLKTLYLQWISHNRQPWSRQCRGSHLTASALICNSDASRVLLIRHAKVGLWLQTGGHIEDGDDSIAAAALREAEEESGLTGLRVAAGLTHLSRHRAPCGQADWHLDLQFTVIDDAERIPPGSAESTGIGWFAADAVPEPTDDPVRELVAASAARLRVG